MENQELTVNELACVANNNLDETSIQYVIDGVTKKSIVTGTQNMKMSKSISVYYVDEILDENGDSISRSKSKQFNVSNSRIYDYVYNGDAIPTFSNGDTQYLMALNGIVKRNIDLGGDVLAQNGHQPWDETDGSLKAEYQVV